MPVFAPVVGTSALAIGSYRVFGCLLDRQTLRLRWQGSIKDAEPVAWSGEDRLLMLDEYLCPFVWSSSDEEVIWRADAVISWQPWGDQVVLAFAPSELEIRDIATGRVMRRLHMSVSPIKSIEVIESGAICLSEDQCVTLVNLIDGTTRWSLEATKSVESTLEPCAGHALIIRTSSDGTRAVLYRQPSLSMVDLVTGRLRWQRNLVTGGLPLISHGRVAFFYAGHLQVINGDSGESIADVNHAADTIHERVPVVHGDWMVVVDEQGYIATVALSDGKVVGVQRETGTGFAGCASVDGRLLVGGLDGALWVYEPSARGEAASDRQGGKASAGKAVLRPKQAHPAPAVGASKGKTATRAAVPARPKRR